MLIAAITSGSNALGIAERLMSLNLKHAASEIDDLTEKLKVVAEADGKGFTEEFGHGRHVKVSSPSMYFVPDMKPCAFHEWVPASKCSPPTLSVMQRYWLGAAPTAVIASAIAAPQMVTPRMISQCRALVHAFFRDLTAGADQLLAVAAERPARGEAH